MHTIIRYVYIWNNNKFIRRVFVYVVRLVRRIGANGLHWNANEMLKWFVKLYILCCDVNAIYTVQCFTLHNKITSLWKWFQRIDLVTVTIDPFDILIVANKNFYSKWITSQAICMDLLYYLPEAKLCFITFFKPRTTQHIRVCSTSSQQYLGFISSTESLKSKSISAFSAKHVASHID